MFIIDKSEIIPLENGLSRLKGKRYDDRKKLIDELKSISDSIDDIGVDYLIYDDEVMYCIERKTVGDLINSITSGRLWMQLQRLKEMENDFNGKFVPILIIEGSEFVMKKIMKGKYGRDWLLGVIIGVINLGVYVIKTKSFGETIKILNKYKNNVDGNKVNKVVFKRAKILNSDDNEIYAILCGINGIGAVKAKKLLDKFGTVRNIFNADKDELIDILGKKVGEHFYDVINKKM
jgi:ERCC4-type nuclease